MRKLLLALLLAASAVPASGQIHVDIQIPLPVSPPLVVVQPGVEVVEGFDDEVFFSGGWFWLRRGPGWYRARSPRATFVWVEPRYVPAPLVRLPPPGHYRQFRAEERAERRQWKARARAERREEKAWKEHRKEERKDWKEREKEERKREHEERKEQRGRGHGDDRGRD